jgi:hypothetical protein
MLLEMIRNIETRPVKEPLADKVENYEESANTAIAILEWMNCFKLVVTDCNAYQVRNGDSLIVPEALEITHESMDFLVMWRNEDGICKGGSANPILTASKLPGRLAFASHSVEQSSVCLTKEAVRKR